MRKTILFSTAMLACFGLAVNTAWAGDVHGQVHARVSRYQKDVVVYVDAIPGRTFDAPKEHALIDQKDMVFTPRVLPVLKGATIDFLNNDDVLHNVFSPDKIADKFNLGTWPKGQKRSYTFKKAGSAVILCNVHPEMEAFVVVVPTPYFAKTDKDGRFKIEGVPAGVYTLKVWQEKKRKAEPQQITVPETGDVSVDFTLKK